jgi:dTDP-4-dehydrorhamnose reductase
MASDQTSISILGGKGMLGSDLAEVLRQHKCNVQVLDLPEFDITKPHQLAQAVQATKVIVNCAAYTNVDGAERQIESAYQINAEAVGRLGALSRKAGVWVMHVSTDFVFDGRLDRPYKETDPPCPINTYGKTKQAGEYLLTQSGCQHCILRIEWTYGSAGPNFVTKLIQSAKTGGALKVVDDQIGSPTATTQVAEVIYKLLSKKIEGLFHFANAGYVNRYDMAKFIFDKLLMDVNLMPCKTSDYESPAARPLNSRFDCSKIQTLLDGPIEPWQKALEHFVRKL